MTATLMDSARDAPTPSVLVTGATGFVGRQLLGAPKSFAIRAAVRSKTADCPGAEPALIGDIDGRTEWRHALAGIDSVVHLAARVHVMAPAAADLEAFDTVNILGTERLAAAAAAAGVRRFIFLSSIKVNGETTQGGGFKASDVPNPTDHYGRSKLEAERRLARIDADSGMRVAVIRPPLVYGPGVKANFARLLAWAARGAPLPLASVANSRSMVSVWNLCDLIGCLLRREPVSGTFMVSDGCDISTPELIRRLAVAMGRPDRLFAAPLSVLRVAAAITGKRAEFARLCGSLRVDIGETCRQLDWTPPVPLDEGLRRTAEWYRGSRHP